MAKKANIDTVTAEGFVSIAAEEARTTENEQPTDSEEDKANHHVDDDDDDNDVLGEQGEEEDEEEESAENESAAKAKSEDRGHDANDASEDEDAVEHASEGIPQMLDGLVKTFVEEQIRQIYVDNLCDGISSGWVTGMEFPFPTAHLMEATTSFLNKRGFDVQPSKNGKRLGVTVCSAYTEAFVVDSDFLEEVKRHTPKSHPSNFDATYYVRQAAIVQMRDLNKIIRKMCKENRGTTAAGRHTLLPSMKSFYEKHGFECTETEVKLILRFAIPEASLFEKKEDTILDALHEEEDNDLTTCVACNEHRRSRILNPCRHFCLCRNCAGKTQNCPVCRTAITYVERVYFS
jgi:hypothetical protein